jgi:hypothetical protein
LVFTCKLKQVEGEDQDTGAVWLLVIEMASVGAPGVCTTDSKTQKPPLKEMLPSVITPFALASGNPTLPVGEWTLPEAAASPPSRMNASV